MSHPFWRVAALLLAALPVVPVLSAQHYDLLLKGGHVIDPANRIDGVFDVAVAGNHIAGVSANIPAGAGTKVVNVSGLYVVPGLVDLHMHVFGYSGSLEPDETALPAGTTTIVDAGGSGWRTFDQFHSSVIARAKTRVLALINIVGAGMVGEPAESNTADMDSEKTADMIKHHRDVVVGIKTAHFGGAGWTAIDRAVAAGKIAGVPVMVDDKIFTNSGRTTQEKLLEHLRPGDIHTHMYNDRQLELINRFTGKVQPWMLQARRRGVLFDLGHGGGSFLWPVASKAAAQGFYPDSISTDLHSESIMIQRSDMPNCMSKMMLLGMSLNDVVLRSTVNPAKEIRRFPELGTLGSGRVADIAVLEEQTGVFAFTDAWPAKRLGTKRLECILTVRDGKIVYEGQRQVTSRPAGPVYDLLLKNGQVIDPSNHRAGRFDVAIISGKIASVGEDLHAAQARKVVDASDYVISPGLIQISKVYRPDNVTLPHGVTTLAITGTAGGKPEPHAKTRILNIARAPESSSPQGEPARQFIERNTATAARTIHRPELGTLAEGSDADLALFENGNGPLHCILTVRHGAVVWDPKGLAIQDWAAAGSYSNFK